eukprot:5540077-Pyramimonas_sp.AAC.1
MRAREKRDAMFPASRGAAARAYTAATLDRKADRLDGRETDGVLKSTHGVILEAFFFSASLCS